MSHPAEGRALHLDAAPDAALDAAPDAQAPGLVAYATSAHLHASIVFASVYIGAATASAGEHVPCAHVSPVGVFVAASAFGGLIVAHLSGRVVFLVFGELVLALVATSVAPDESMLARCAWNAQPLGPETIAALALTLASWGGLVSLAACVLVSTFFGGHWPLEPLRRAADVAVMRVRAGEPTPRPLCAVALRLLPTVVYQLVLVPLAAVSCALALGAVLVLQQSSGGAARLALGSALPPR